MTISHELTRKGTSDTGAHSWPFASMRGFERLLAALWGDPRRLALEHRLFNAISLLNAVTNTAGAAALLGLDDPGFLLPLNLAVGLLFLAFYLVSRLRGVYRPVYWPFVLLIASFLFVNSVANAGSAGGAHYYLIPALAIATILSPGPRATAAAVALFGGATLGVLAVERWRPEWVAPYASPDQRFLDVSGNLLFAQVFTSALVLVLAQALNQERRKSDRLLLSILPRPVADELKANDRVEPSSYEGASVLFTDFAGFTQAAERMWPRELVGELDACFRRFDAVATRHGLEKIKTIGDAYMAVGGVPAPNATHAVDCVLAALEIASAVAEARERREAEGRPYWRVRVGIHTGPLVAGVIGEQKFAYDVWGDTVNTASRLESSGVPDRVNISAATYERVKDFFECEHRGRVAAKNKGEIDMYLVVGLRPQLSRGGDGRAPNERFAELYAAL
jgi:adenylate cyclase